MSITLEQAQEIAQAKIQEVEGAYEGDEMVLLTEATLERDFGWVFFYNTRLFAETQNPDVAVIGPAPLIIDRRDGSAHWTGTAAPLENYLHQYEQQRQPD